MDFIELLKVIFLGIVEGITEWLPVSSTGHMILVDEFITLKVSEAFWKMFLVVIQLGAVLAVVVLDFKKLWPFHMNDPARVVLSHNIVGVFAKQKAQCEGIAKAVKVLLNAVDIKCIVATGNANGNGQNGPHAWNIVNIEGSPYQRGKR